MKYFFSMLCCLSVLVLNSQTDSTHVKQVDSIPKWELKNRTSLDINEVSFVNWSAGGSNSISALLGVRSELNYRYGLFKWKNLAVANYGVNKQEDQKLRKTTDELELISTLGFQTDSLSKWYFSARFNFKTQFTNGYNYPNRSTHISKFMSPGYLFLGGGVEYGKDVDKFSVYFSPMTFKSTFVLDEALSNAGSFGVTPAVFDDQGNIIKHGQRVRTEIGILLTNYLESRVYDNVDLKSRISFYTDYLNSFGNIDLDWEVIFNFKVNQYVRATLGSHLRYDNDVKTFVNVLNELGTEEEMLKEGAKMQWKQILGIGVVVDL